MSAMMIEAPTAAEAMRSWPDSLHWIPPCPRPATGCGRRMAPFLVVIGPETQKLLGIVTWSILERACASGSHEPATCSSSATWRRTRTSVSRRGAPRRCCARRVDRIRFGDPRTDAGVPVVVNVQKVPIGYFER